MQAAYAIRILERDANRVGDLFARLMQDLFLSLGYDDIHVAVQKSGRELDLEATHRLEPKRAIAECKATAEPVGGADVNKFVGVADAERRRGKGKQLVSYYVSLSGFRETAKEQEREAGGKRLVMLDGGQVVGELIRGRVIISLEAALERAGRLAVLAGADLRPHPPFELLAHKDGWVWAIYFGSGGQRTHFALIHADGDPLGDELAGAVVASDTATAGRLRGLERMRAGAQAQDALLDEAKAKYYAYLAEECGDIQLEGLPVDEQLGSRRLRLEQLFVPLYVESVEEADSSEPSPHGPQPPSRRRRLPFGRAIARNPRLAVLSAPGAGKSTLLKRLAVAYAFPERRELLSDHLPDRDWVPILLRCRQLGDHARLPVGEALKVVAAVAEMSELAEPLALVFRRALREGKALLLVDGLDEIPDERSRLAFAHQLRTFLSRYPSVSAVVTSREAGFRVIGGTLSRHCAHYSLADFDDADIRRLILAWHSELLGRGPQVRAEADELARTICTSDRLCQLARNPLLLTTLLLVQRWVGQLPTRRTVLYGKAIEVLLMTWNVEAHEPLRLDEVLPQLAFLAFAMMKDGIQQITRRQLHEIVARARAEMPEILSFCDLSVSQLIERVELRSSLLMLSGHGVENGTLTPVYEFRHLTFQEYLAALAAVQGYYPGGAYEDLSVALAPHLGDENWKEVAPLAAALAGRKAAPLVQQLVGLCKASSQKGSARDRDDAYPSLLAQCIMDEVQVPPELLEEALVWVARHGLGPAQHIIPIYRSRYGSLFADVATREYMGSSADLAGLGSTLGEITLTRLGGSAVPKVRAPVATKLSQMLLSGDGPEVASAALALMEDAFHVCSRKGRADAWTQKHLAALACDLVAPLGSGDPCLGFAASWALVWLSAAGAVRLDTAAAALPHLLAVWCRAHSPELQRQPAWAICVLPLVPPEDVSFTKPTDDLVSFIRDAVTKEPASEFHRGAALIISYYLDAPWGRAELPAMIGREDLAAWRARALLTALGEPGQRRLRELQRSKRRTGSAPVLPIPPA